MWRHNYLWQIRVKDHAGNIHRLGNPMLYHEAIYWRNRILTLDKWCQLKRVSK